MAGCPARFAPGRIARRTDVAECMSCLLSRTGSVTFRSHIYICAQRENGVAKIAKSLGGGGSGNEKPSRQRGWGDARKALKALPKLALPAAQLRSKPCHDNLRAV